MKANKDATPTPTTSNLLKHISNNITKLMEVIDDIDDVAPSDSSWATNPTLPRLNLNSEEPAEPTTPKEDVNLVPYLKLLAVLLSSLTTIVITLTAALQRLLELRRQAIIADEAEQLKEEEEVESKKRKRGRQKKDILADDGTHVIILTSQQLPQNLSDDYFVADLNNDFHKLSTRYPHNHIPIPFMDVHRVGNTIEGIWEGLKVYEHADVDADCMVATSSRSIKRKHTNTLGKLKGWRNGLRGKNVLTPEEAREQILMVMYKHVLETHAKKEVELIESMRDKGKVIVIVCEKHENGWQLSDENFGAAGLLKLRLVDPEP